MQVRQASLGKGVLGSLGNILNLRGSRFNFSRRLRAMSVLNYSTEQLIRFLNLSFDPMEHPDMKFAILTITDANLGYIH